MSESEFWKCNNSHNLDIRNVNKNIWNKSNGEEIINNLKIRVPIQSLNKVEKSRLILLIMFSI